MATAPAFTATPHSAAVLTNASADTSETAPTNIATLFTAGASGSRVEQIRLNQILTTTAAGTINIFLYDGTTYHLWDFFVYAANTVSTVLNPGAVDFFYNNLLLTTGWSIRVTNTVASGTGTTAATHKLVAMGGDF